MGVTSVETWTKQCVSGVLLLCTPCCSILKDPFCDHKGNPSRTSVAPCCHVLRCCVVCFSVATTLLRNFTGVSTLRHYQNVLILPQGVTCLLRILFPLSRSVSLCSHMSRTHVTSPSQQRRNTRNTNPATVSIRP